MLSSAVDLIDSLSTGEEDEGDDDQASSGKDSLADDEGAPSEKAAGLNPSDQIMVERFKIQALLA